MSEEKSVSKGTTLFVDVRTKHKVAVIARTNERTMAAQIRFWANREYAELENSKALPVSEPSENKD